MTDPKQNLNAADVLSSVDPTENFYDTLSNASSGSADTSSDPTESFYNRPKLPSFWKPDNQGRIELPASLKVGPREQAARFLSGIGIAGLNTFEGIGQNIGLVSREDVAASQAKTDRFERFPAVKAGKVIGDVGKWATLPLTAEGYVGAAGLGALTGAFEPSKSTEETAKNIGFGAVTGPIFHGVSNAAGWALDKYGKPIFNAFKGKLGINPSEQSPGNIESPLTGFGNHSAGAAEAPVDLSVLKPNAQKAVQQHIASGGTPNPEVLERHAIAHDLPDPIDLTEGEATRDATLFSGEVNDRTSQPKIQARRDETDRKLVNNMNLIRKNGSPDYIQSNATDLDQHMIDHIKTYDEQRVAPINEAYSRVRDIARQAGHDFEIDMPSWRTNVNAELKDQMLSGAAEHSDKLQSVLKDSANSDSLDFAQFETLRTRLAEASRSTNDPAEKRVIAIYRNNLEKLPLKNESAEMKEIADHARSLAASRFNDIRDNPAYAAAIEDSAKIGTQSTLATGKFNNTYFTGNGPNASRAHVSRFRALVNDPNADSIINAATTSELKTAAGLIGSKDETFSPAGFNGRLFGSSRLNEKLDSLVDPDTARYIRNLNSTAHNARVYPANHSVNTSNTATARGMAGDTLMNVGEGYINAHTLGIGGKVARWGASHLLSGPRVERALRPAAGIDFAPKLQEFPQ